MVDLEGLDQHVAQFHFGPVSDLRDFHIESIDGGSLFMHDATLQFRSPDFQELSDEFLGSSWSDDLVASVASLVPGRDDELEQVHHVIRMQVGQQQQVNLGTGSTSRAQSLCHS